MKQDESAGKQTSNTVRWNCFHLLPVAMDVAAIEYVVAEVDMVAPSSVQDDEELQVCVRS
jgi:hypothetical protein